MEFFSFLSTSFRSHWPIHGPQAFASTLAPIASRSPNKPSRSMVARTCSEPGEIKKGTRVFKPLAFACRAM